MENLSSLTVTSATAQERAGAGGRVHEFVPLAPESSVTERRRRAEVVCLEEWC